MNTGFEAAAGLLRGVMAGILLTMFVGLWFWAFGPARRARFDSASMLPLEEDRRQDGTP